jgi:hypothetical protein
MVRFQTLQKNYSLNMIQGMAGFEYYRAFKQDTEQGLCSLSIKPISEDSIFSF